ncbi:hypothetical protein CKO11_03370 [Rhodobacter sp. TJ_12]|uniref:restriction endonuclease n=1 Tax=Rhodobacter sp. TJ_12 TaxID=2029399 RepID=UPI001CBC8360|nr:restriction endonuclease [Rhodobacter sp. TJ_12]MBZ4021500.1 hypothetical protein [Rhodobacter sp. TJ_12]
MSNDDIKSLGSFVWSIAELLRCDFKQSENGKVILPFVVLHRLDCILEGTKQAVLDMAASLPADMDDDAVYIQAKRDEPSYKVGRPDLQRFVGSLTGEGATKGVFVTTSDFSRDAVLYVEKVQHRIRLINGQQLAGLMIQYGVGVRARSTYTINSVDEDYFAEG